MLSPFVDLFDFLFVTSVELWLLHLLLFYLGHSSQIIPFLRKSVTCKALTYNVFVDTISSMKAKLYLLFPLITLSFFSSAYAVDSSDAEILAGITKRVEKDDDDDDDDDDTELGERRSLSTPGQIEARKKRIEKQRAAKREATRKRIAQQRRNQNRNNRNKR